MSATIGFRGQLLAELERRKRANPRYSLRSFARHLRVSPAFLSNVLNGRRSLSISLAVEIAERLGFSDEGVDEFCQLVQIDSQSSDKAKQVILRGTAKDSAAIEMMIGLDSFQLISDWHHFAILELTQCKTFQKDPAWIAKKLGITPQAAADAVERLLRVGLLKSARGRLKKSKPLVACISHQPSRALRHFHSQMIEKAKNSIEAQSVEARDITGITMAICDSSVEVVKKEIERFRHRMAKKYGTEQADRVYQLNVQFFDLTSQPRSKELV